jgi:segregation and condensation protein B
MTEPIDVLEALLFASDAPVEPALIQEVLELPSAQAARDLVEALRARFDEQARVLQIIEAGGGFRLVTRPEVAPWLVKLARSKTRSRLSRPALETLAIIAYRQPVSRPEVDATRGVNSEGVLDSLLERRLIRIAGRKESAGRPFLYETTREFLVAFGLRDLGDLPKAEGELIVVDPTAGDTAVAGPAADVDEASAARADEASAPVEVDDVDGARDDADALVAPEPAEGTLLADPDARDGASEEDVAPGDVDAGPVGVDHSDMAPRGADVPPHAAADPDRASAAAPDEAATDSKEPPGAVDPPEQDPGPVGTDVAPGR